MLAGLLPRSARPGMLSITQVGETTIGLYKTECIRDGSPFRNGPLRTLADLDDVTSAWVHNYNTSRLMHRLGRRPPAEAEAARSCPGAQREVCMKPGCLNCQGSTRRPRSGVALTTTTPPFSTMGRPGRASSAGLDGLSDVDAEFWVGQ
jgi:hypothetical protein